MVINKEVQNDHNTCRMMTKVQKETKTKLQRWQTTKSCKMTTKGWKWLQKDAKWPQRDENDSKKMQNDHKGMKMITKRHKAIAKRNKWLQRDFKQPQREATWPQKIHLLLIMCPGTPFIQKITSLLVVLMMAMIHDLGQWMRELSSWKKSHIKIEVRHHDICDHTE